MSLMETRGSIQILDQGRVLAELGPMRLVIQGSIGGIPQVGDCLKAARKGFSCLTRIASVRAELKRPAAKINGGLKEPLARKMMEAASLVDPEDLTPMAAVAGVIADSVADCLAQRGMTRVVVNNGGDIAIRLGRGESVRVGVVDKPDNSGPSRSIRLGPGSWGVATSGLGGRSFTSGVATAVTIVATSAAIADAAATSVANASFVDDPGAVQVPAHTLDPGTDIPHKLVTVKSHLSPAKRQKALELALSRAARLLKKGVILGAYVNVQGTKAWLGPAYKMV